MNAGQVIDALGLPVEARLDQRVPKKLLAENGAPTAADKRRIQDGVEEIQWVATLKPATVGVPAYRDDEREYLEIAVLNVTLRPDAKAARLNELTHRAIPYPVFLLTSHGERVTLSLAHKRWSQGETGKTVLDGPVIQIDPKTAGADEAPEDSAAQPFLNALGLSRQPRGTMFALYDGWADAFFALQAARITGVFVPPRSAEQAALRRAGLRACQELETRIAALWAAAAKEKRIARQVELNLEINRLQADLTLARRNLNWEPNS